MSDLFRGEAGRDINTDFPRPSFFDTEGKGELDKFLLPYLKKYEVIKDKGYIALFSGNHDMPRLNVRRSQEDLKLAHAFLLTMPGVPFIYYGDEIGMAYQADLPSKEGGFNRTGARTPMQWCKGKNAGFSTGKAEDLYLPVQEDRENVADQLADENSLLNTVKALIRLRKASPALSATGDLEFLNRENNGYPRVYRRSGSDGSYICAVVMMESISSASIPQTGSSALPGIWMGQRW